MNKLKYLFEVTYKDGSIYKQNEEDKPVIKEIGSSFSDVIQENVKTFTLIGEGNRYMVNLEDGHFEVNGIPFLMHEENDLLKDFRLVFWRRHTHSFNRTMAEETSHIIVYRLGWQANDRKGNNIQQIMQIE